MKEFLLSLISSNSDNSSKRFAGLILAFGNMIFSFVYIVILTYLRRDIPENILSLLTTIFYVGSGLIGLGVLEHLKKLN